MDGQTQDNSTHNASHCLLLVTEA